MKRNVFSPDWFPVKVKKTSSTGSVEFELNYNCDKNLFELTDATGKTESYSFKHLGRLFSKGRYFYCDLGKDGYSRPAFTNKEEIIAYANENPTEKVLAFSEKSYEVYSIMGGRYFVNGEQTVSIPEGLYLLHPCTRFRVFETEKAPEKKSFPFLTAFTSFAAGVAATFAFVCYKTQR